MWGRRVEAEGDEVSHSQLVVGLAWKTIHHLNHQFVYPVCLPLTCADRRVRDGVGLRAGFADSGGITCIWDANHGGAGS